VDVATSPLKQIIGLIGKKDGALFFDFKKEKHLLFWTFGLRFPINIIIIRDNQVDQVIPAKKPFYLIKASKVLELPTYHKIDIGDKLRWQ
jgi:uncharacterized membrane protein (UPF0127 family)